MRRFIALGVIATMSLIGCGGGGASTAPSQLASTAPSQLASTAPSQLASTAPSAIASTAPSSTLTVVGIGASDDLKFTPAQVAVKPGATVTFTVTNTGRITHEFLVGPKDAVDADSHVGTVEIEDIAAGETKEISFTFGTTGAYAFACHVPGHFEAGMKGAITLAP